MRRIVLSVLLLAAVGVAWADEDPEPPAKAGPLVGYWKLKEIRAKGMVVPLPQEFEMAFDFSRDGTAQVSAPGQQAKGGKWKANPAKKPAELDLTGDGMTSKLIYKIEKDTLSIAGVEGLDGGGRNGPRPKDFDAANMVMVFVKADKKPK